MKGLPGQDSGEHPSRDDGREWIDEPLPGAEVADSASNDLSPEVGLHRVESFETARHDVYIPGASPAAPFDQLAANAERAGDSDAGGVAHSGQMAHKGEWPEPSEGEERRPVPLHHQLIQVATELRDAIGGALSELGVQPMQHDEAVRHLSPSRASENLPGEAPLVQFARGAALVERAMRRCKKIELRRKDGVEQLRLAGYEARIGFRSLKAASDLMNDVRIAAYSLGRMS